MIESAPVFSVARQEILIRKVADPGGWMSNMSPHSIIYEGREWWHAEALFQALRLKDEVAREEIREHRSPMKAKLIAKRFRELQVVEPMSRQDIENMRLCIELKLKRHAPLRRMLLATGDSRIIEDCSSRGRRGTNLFWGAVRVPPEAAGEVWKWEGHNVLGRLWMEFRAQLRAAAI